MVNKSIIITIVCPDYVVGIDVQRSHYSQYRIYFYTTKLCASRSNRHIHLLKLSHNYIHDSYSIENILLYLFPTHFTFLCEMRLNAFRQNIYV